MGCRERFCFSFMVQRRRSARAVLSQEVLVLHILGRRSRARVDLNRQKRHFRHFLQHRGMIYSLRRVFAPCERPMAAADDTGHMDRINVPRTECLNDDRSGIFLVIFFHLRARERARAGHRPVEIVRMCCAVARDIPSGLCPGHRMDAVSMHHASDLRECPIQLQMRFCVR